MMMLLDEWRNKNEKMYHGNHCKKPHDSLLHYGISIILINTFDNLLSLKKLNKRVHYNP
jgi:hypothetical protein